MKKLALFQSLVIVGLVVGLFLMRGCYKKEIEGQKTDYETQLTKEKLQSQNFQEVINENNKNIQMQDAIITDNQEVIRSISDENFDLKKKNDKLTKKVLAFSSQSTETRIDSIPVPFVDTTERQRFADSIEAKCADVISFYESNYIKVPRTAKQETDSFSADLTATKTGITINSLSVPDSTYSRIIEKKGGFFRKVLTSNKKGVSKLKLKFHVPRTIEFQSFHTNPLVKVRGQTSLFYTPKKKAKWIVPLTLGVAGGLILGSK